MAAKKLKKITPAEKEKMEKKFIEYMQKNRDALVGEFIRAVWRGVGKLDEAAARTVYKEVQDVCNKKIYGTILLSDIMGYDLSKPLDMKTASEILENGQNVFGEGSGKVMQKGKVALECSDPHRCICPWVEFFGVVDRNENQCLYCTTEGYTAWYELLLKKPVKVSKIYGVANSGTCGDWKIELK
jgi:hypothetical protein